MEIVGAILVTAAILSGIALLGIKPKTQRGVFFASGVIAALFSLGGAGFDFFINHSYSGTAAIALGFVALTIILTLIASAIRAIVGAVARGRQSIR